MEEKEVWSYTRSIIKGLIHIHKNQYVHCDLKPENILLVPRNSANGRRCVAKIGDLGLAKRTSKTKKDRYLRGTVPYMAPETLLYSVQESPSDIWALGCVVLEMLTGNRPWSGGGGGDDTEEITRRFGEKYEIPIIPEGAVLSAEARAFLKVCFVRKPEYRFTAEMLMLLPFLAEDEEEEEESVVGAPRFVEKARRSKRQRIPIQAV